MAADDMTFPELLDNAQSGEEFGALLGGMFSTLDRLRREEEDES